MRATVVTFIYRVPVGSIKFNWILTTTTTSTTWPPLVRARGYAATRAYYSIYCIFSMYIMCCVCVYRRRTSFYCCRVLSGYCRQYTVFTRNYLDKPSQHTRAMGTHYALPLLLRWRDGMPLLRCLLVATMLLLLLYILVTVPIYFCGRRAGGLRVTVIMYRL